jgi:hypothetical protein
MSYVIIAIVLILIMVPILWSVRKYFREWMDQTETKAGPAFTLGDLRDLHKSGAMTDAEFERAKAVLIGQTKAAAAAEAKKPPNAPGNPPRRSAPDPRYRPPT